MFHPATDNDSAQRSVSVSNDLNVNLTGNTAHHVDVTMTVPEPARNRFYILFPAKGIMSCRQIISNRLCVRLKGPCSLANRSLINAGE